MVHLIAFLWYHFKEDSAIVLSNMAKALVIKFKSFQAANETREIIRGLSIILEASMSTSNEVKRQQNSGEIKDWIDDSNEARNKDHQEKVRLLLYFNTFPF